MTKKIMTIDDLRSIKERVEDKRKKFKMIISICGGTACHASGSLNIKPVLMDAIIKNKLSDEILVIESGCNGFCAMGPIMTILPERIFYQKISVEDIDEIVKEHLVKGLPVRRLMFKDPVTGEIIPRLDDIPFFSSQELRVLRNKGLIDPEDIEDYIWRDGYLGAYKALMEMAVTDITREVKASGLRGRGGAGFPTGIKWEFCANSKGETKYVLCNADEGDPGAFMDRSIMEADPHSVLEGMIIGAKAINAHKGYIYCRAEYPLAIKRLEIAIKSAHEYGLLGKDIMGSGFDFDIEIYQGAGAFVCGEETALMISIEGKRGMPRPRPPFPAISGLWGKPTVLNNVETWASVAQIILKSAEYYSSIGTESSKGTKVFALTGKVNNIGLVEVPMGTSLGDIIFDIGGGMPKDKKFKAAQLGGPSGGCITSEHLNLPTDYEAIAQVGAIMGSGGMIVMDEDTCMVDMARYFMEFCCDESCGKCTSCRVGTKRMLEILENICKGKGKEGDIELLEKMAAVIKDSALCGLGQTAPNPVLSTIKYFREEYEAHIRDKHCPAGVCGELFESICQNACPLNMEIPKYIALIRAGRTEDAYKVLKRTNPFPGICGRVCGHPCQNKCRRSQVDEPLAIKNLKRFITDLTGTKKLKPIEISRPEKIAIIGAGPGGLSAALELKKRGYAVTVFESLPEAGGMLRYGIPAYRLPRNILAKEISDILDTGVELRTDTLVGRDITFDELDMDYDLILIAVGAQKSSPLNIPGDNVSGVYGAIEFLRSHNMGIHVAVGKNVVVIGGGNSAIDASRTAVRLGADSVTVCYRREKKDMPAQKDEIEAAEAEGVKFEFLVTPEEVITKNGAVTGAAFARMQLGQFDKSGRRRAEPIVDNKLILDAETVIAAIGQRTDFEFLSGDSVIETGRSTIKVDRNYRTSNPKIWAIGDAVTGPAMVVDAIAAGKNASGAMDDFLREADGLTKWESMDEEIDIPFEVDLDIIESPQAIPPDVDPCERIKDFREVELCYYPEIAKNEACRCLRCDVRA